MILKKITAHLKIYRKSKEGFCYYLKNGEAHLTGYKPSSPKWIQEIPDSLDGFPVVALETLQDIPFKGEIVIPDTVREISELGLAYHEQVTKYILPESIQKIGEHPFGFCRNLQEIVFPDNLKTLPLGAVSENRKLKKICLPESLEEIPDCFASNCYSLEEIVIPKHVKIIGKMAFYNCYSLKKIILPAHLKLIKKYAFLGCSELNTKNVAIPANCEVCRMALKRGKSND